MSDMPEFDAPDVDLKDASSLMETMEDIQQELDSNKNGSELVKVAIEASEAKTAAENGEFEVGY